jgi:hypothetical protein
LSVCFVSLLFLYILFSSFVTAVYSI